jgi:hypothetical protein
MEETKNACRLLVRKTDGRRPLGRSRRRWVDKIKMDLGEKERENVVLWTVLMWPRIGNSGGLL